MVGQDFRDDLHVLALKDLKTALVGLRLNLKLSHNYLVLRLDLSLDSLDFRRLDLKAKTFKSFKSFAIGDLKSDLRLGWIH